MKEPISRYFQMGTLTWMSFPSLSTLEAVKRVAADEYFTAVEVRSCRDDAEREEVRRVLEQAHLTVYYGAHPDLLSMKLNPNAVDEAERQRAETFLKHAVDEASYLGPRGMAFLAGKWEEKTKERAYSQLLKTTIQVCRYAEEKGLKVELELFDHDVDKAVLMGPASYGAAFAADVRRQCGNFGLLADLSHMPLTRETAREVIPAIRPYLTHLHFGNAVTKPGCPGYGDKHPRMGFPGGCNDVPELLDFLQVLKEEGFFREEDPLPMSMEVTVMDGESEDAVLAGTKRAFNRAWALL